MIFYFGLRHLCNYITRGCYFFMPDTSYSILPSIAGGLRFSFTLTACCVFIFDWISVFARIASTAKCVTFRKNATFLLALCLLGHTPNTPFRKLYLILTLISDIKPIFYVSGYTISCNNSITCENFPLSLPDEYIMNKYS